MYTSLHSPTNRHSSVNQWTKNIENICQSAGARRRTVCLHYFFRFGWFFNGFRPPPFLAGIMKTYNCNCKFNLPIVVQMLFKWQHWIRFKCISILFRKRCTNHFQRWKHFRFTSFEFTFPGIYRKQYERRRKTIWSNTDDQRLS